MSVDDVLDAIRTLPRDERLILAHTILDELDGPERPLSPREKHLIDRRLAAYAASGRAVTWEEFLAAALPDTGPMDRLGGSTS